MRLTGKLHWRLRPSCRKDSRGYRALWKHIMNVSVTDLKKNYGDLNVDFDLWKGESDAQPYIPDMVAYAERQWFCHVRIRARWLWM